MSNKTLNLTINEEDLKPILVTVLQAFLTRQMSALETCGVNINSSLQDNDSQSLFESLKELLASYNKASQEVINLSVLIDELKPSSPDTEVVEDLPDLLEDSSRVD